MSLAFRCDNICLSIFEVSEEAIDKGFAYYLLRYGTNIVFNKNGYEYIISDYCQFNCKLYRFLIEVGFREIEFYGHKYLGLSRELIKTKYEVAGCRLVPFGDGKFSDIPFIVKRIYYIHDVKEGTLRGFHAHKNLKQLIFCPYGEIILKLESRQGKGIVDLSDNKNAILVEEPVWREMLWLRTGSVLCVLASDYYNENDYIRNYTDFKHSYLKNE